VRLPGGLELHQLRGRHGLAHAGMPAQGAGCAAVLRTGLREEIPIGADRLADSSSGLRGGTCRTADGARWRSIRWAAWLNNQAG